MSDSIIDENNSDHDENLEIRRSELEDLKKEP